MLFLCRQEQRKIHEPNETSESREEPAPPATNQHINTDEFVCFRWLAKMAVCLAARVLIPIKQASSQLTAAPWRPQQNSEADRIQQKLHKNWVWSKKKKKNRKAEADVSCLSVCVHIHAVEQQREADLFKFCDYLWLLILKILTKRIIWATYIQLFVRVL